MNDWLCHVLFVLGNLGLLQLLLFQRGGHPPLDYIGSFNPFLHSEPVLIRCFAFKMWVGWCLSWPSSLSFNYYMGHKRNCLIFYKLKLYIDVFGCFSQIKLFSGIFFCLKFLLFATSWLLNFINYLRYHLFQMRCHLETWQNLALAKMSLPKSSVTNSPQQDKFLFHVLYDKMLQKARKSVPWLRNNGS